MHSVLGGQTIDTGIIGLGDTGHGRHRRRGSSEGVTDETQIPPEARYPGMMLLQAACEGCKSPFIIALFLVSPPTASRFTTSVFEYRALLARNSPKVKSLKKWGPSADRS